MLQYIEQNPLYQVFQNNGWTNIKDVKVNVLVCPSRVRGITTPAPLSYVVNCGMIDNVPPLTAGAQLDYQENGVFFDAYTPAVTVNVPKTVIDGSLISRHDGTSTTVLFSENVDAMDWIQSPSGVSDYWPLQLSVWHGQSWWQGIIWALPPNNPNGYIPSEWSNFLVRSSKGDIISTIGNPHLGTDGQVWQSLKVLGSTALPSSNQPGGFLITMCDGHTIFVSQEMDYRVYCLIMAPDNSNAKYTIGAMPVGQTVVYPASFNTPLGVGHPLIPLTDADLK